MSLWKIAWRSLQRRALSSSLTGLSMALGVALVIAVIVIHSVIQHQFSQGAQGYHLIVGAKGGKLQLVLNTVYHLSQPIENIPYSFYQEFVKGRFASSTEVAVPYCLGDSFPAAGQTFRVVATTPDMFDKLVYGRQPDGTPLRYAFRAGGRNFKQENFYEAVIGSVVASQTGLSAGDTFNPTHSIVEPGQEGEQHDAFTIVGVLEPTGTPNDRALFINMEGFYLLPGHALSPPEEENGDDDAPPTEKDANNTPELETDEHSAKPAGAAHADQGDHGNHDQAEHDVPPLAENRREVTAILVLFKGELYSYQIARTINKGRIAQAVYPSQEITSLFSTIVGPMQLVLLLLTVMVVLVAGIGIMVSIYNSMSDRRHEIAVMRALGAGRRTVMAVILLESILLSLAGGAVGMLIGHGLMGLASPYVVGRTGVALHAFQFDPKELILVPALIVLASLVGYLPALAAYRTDVARSLSANP